MSASLLTRADPALLTRRAPSALALRPETANDRDRTVDAVLTTGAPVRRAGFIERLAIAADNVALPVAVPLLNAHRTDSIHDVLGTATAFRREDGAIVATLRILDDSLWAKVLSRAVTGISIGYVVAEWRDSTESGVRVRTAIRWTIREVSAVPLPADAEAVIRSTRPKESTMPRRIPAANAAAELPDDAREDVTPETVATRAAPVANDATAPTTREPANDDVRTRAAVNAEIRSIARAANLGGDFADGLIDRGASVEAARAEAFERMTANAGRPIRAQVGPSAEDPAVVATRREEAIAHRMAPDLCQLPDAARPYAAMSVAAHARDVLTRAGERGLAAMSDEAVIVRAQHTVSDFPGLLDGAGNRILAASYTAAASPVRTALGRQRNLRDFRAASLLRLDGPAALAPVTESGEIKAVTAGEHREGFALKTFAGLFNLSRVALINDDLGAFADWNRQMGRAAAETEAGQIVGLLTANAGMGAKLADGKALFHADHGNILAAGGLSVATLDAARVAMRRQKGPNGTPANVVPRFLLVSPEEETSAEQVVAALAATTVADGNPFAGKLAVLVEPRLTAGAWMLFADPAASPVIEWAYLASAPGPQLASRDGWDVLGRSFRVVLDFGCGVVDHRGAVRNPGDTL